MLTKEKAAQDLVEWHYKVDSGLTQAIRLFAPNEDDPHAPINLLEVSTETLASGNVMTFTFGPTDEFPYSMRIATITPDEMEQVRRHEISMPEGWSLENAFFYPVNSRMAQGGRRWRRSKESARSLTARCNGHKPFPSYLTRLNSN